MSSRKRQLGDALLGFAMGGAVGAIMGGSVGAVAGAVLGAARRSGSAGRAQC
jgi:hypothetical protein